MRSLVALGWLESILEVGASQELWDRALERAIQVLGSLRKKGTWSWGPEQDRFERSQQY